MNASFKEAALYYHRHPTGGSIRSSQLPMSKRLFEFGFGSISEIITLESLCSGDERKAVLFCCQISGVFSSQFVQKQNKEE